MACCWRVLFPVKAREMMNDLDRIEGAPSYICMRQKELKLDKNRPSFNSSRASPINLTDKPLTREMDRLFMGINDKIADKTGGSCCDNSRRIARKIFVRC